MTGRDLPTGAQGSRVVLRRNVLRRDALAARAESLRNGARAGAKILAERFGATRVILFGSVARGAVHADSDIDLAVWGVLPTAQWDAGLAAEDAAGARVDLVRMESAPEAMRERVRADGVELVPGE